MDKTARWKVNKKQVAEFFGVSVQAVDGWMQRGCPYKRKGRRLEFYLPDVTEWRNNYRPQSDRENARIEEFGARLAEDLCTRFYPALVSSSRFVRLITNLAVEDLGLTKVQAMQAYQHTVLALSHAFAEALQLDDDDDPIFTVPEIVVELADIGCDEYVKRHWN